jgi:hypothetical protein
MSQSDSISICSLLVITIVALTAVWVHTSRRRFQDGSALVWAGDKAISAALNAASLTSNHSGGLRVQYGADYFRFFRSLGEASYTVLDAGGEIVFSTAFTLRSTPVGRCWYVADYRVAPEHRGRWLGFRQLMVSIAWPWLKCPHMFGLSMGNSFPKYLTWLQPLLRAVLVRFFIIEATDGAALSAVPERYKPLRVLDRSGVKDLYLGNARLRLQHLCPRDAPGRSAGTTALEGTDCFMMMALPGEWETEPPALTGVIVHNLPWDSNFEWLGSGDL